jgi:hypothetical protein
MKLLKELAKLNKATYTYKFTMSDEAMDMNPSPLDKRSGTNNR